MDGVVSDCNATAATKPDQHVTRGVVIACTDDFFGLHLVDLYFLFCRSYLDLYNNQLQQLHPGVFSDLTSLRSLTCVVVCIDNAVCIVVYDFRAYYVQPKTKAHRRGRVKNNALKQSCTTFCQLYMSTLYCLMRCQMIMIHRP
jgi:hypothetical protein